MIRNEAETLAAGIDEPGGQARALVAVFDALKDQERKHKFAVLDRATFQAKAATAPAGGVVQLAAVAERWYEGWGKGKGEDARERRTSPGRKPFESDTRVWAVLTPPLARFDLPSALAIAKEFSPTGIDSEASILVNIAFHLAATTPPRPNVF